MTRIISGQAGGRRLKVPAGLTRPTSDRVRESLFASLENVLDLRGLRVLDLYAGSGALGLEALSRGAARVVLVDQSVAATQVIADNIAAVGLPGARARRATVSAYLRAAPSAFDLVLIDPPYDLPSREVELVVDALICGWLAPAAVVVVERGVHTDPVVWPAGFGEPWNRRFGGTHVQRAVWYGREEV